MSSTDIFQVSTEFIDEAQLGRTMQKKGGPYNKKDRHARRQEVYRLHFEHGYSAVKVSELMKINRNTINNDIKFLYSKLKRNLDNLDTDSLIMKQILRIEEQRTRFLEQLEKTESLESKLSLEKMIMENDNRLTGIYSKLRDVEKIIIDTSVNKLNKWLEEMDLGVRTLTDGNLIKLSEPTYLKIRKMMKEDKLTLGWRGRYQSK